MDKLAYIFIWFFMLICQMTMSQITHPKISPFSSLKQDVGLVTITVDYSRPSVRGRKIVGDLMPYDRIWRVGANESTKFTTSHEITIGEHLLKKGTYALYAIPHKEYWEIIFHNNLTHWGDGRKAYKPEEDEFRLHIRPETITDFQETFLITINGIGHNSGVMEWIWEHTKVSIPISVDTDAMMIHQIEYELKNNPTAMGFYQAARYYQEQDKDEKKVLTWLDQAEKKGGKTYYIHRIRSLVFAKLNRYKRAIKEAKASLKIADSLGKDEFVRMNEKNIEKWNKLLN